MVGVQVRAYLRVDAGRSLAVFASLLVLATHAIHIGRRTTEVAQVTLEVRHGYHLLHLLQDALLASANDELALVGGNRTERTTAETAAVDVDGELNHLVSRNGLALVLRMRQTGVWQVEGSIQFLGRHGREWRVDHHHLVIDSLYHALGMHLVGFLLQVSHVLCLPLLVVKALLMAVEDDVIVLVTARNLTLLTEEDGLRHFTNFLNLLSLVQFFCQLDDGLLTHAIEYHVSPRLAQDTLLELVLPIVIVADTPHGCLDASQCHRYIGEKLLQDLRIDDGWIVRTHIMS